MTIFHTISDLRSALVNILGEGFNNYGDVDYITYGGDQLKFDPEYDTFEIVGLYTPDDGAGGWTLNEAHVNLNDLLYNQRSEDDRRSLPDDLPLYSVDLTDRAKKLASVVGKEGEFDTMREEAANEGDTPHADFVAELLVHLLLGVTGYSGYTEHRTLVELPNGLTLRDTYGDEEAAATFVKLETEAEGQLLKWGLKFAPRHNHISEADRDKMQTKFGNVFDMAKDASKEAARGAGLLSDNDEPLALHCIESTRRQLENALDMLQSIEDGYFEDLER